MATQEEKQLIIAEDRVLKASKLLESWYRYMLKIETFTLEDMSDPEIDFMDAVKQLRKAQKKPKKVAK